MSGSRTKQQKLSVPRSLVLAMIVGTAVAIVVIALG